MLATSANNGQLWIFGGEFASPTQSQFYHYRDLWVYHIAKKQWEKITAPNGPSARSGHRMVLIKKKIFLFGGFHDNLRDYKYFNDIYSFNIETYTWSKIEPSGMSPPVRSGCCMAPLADGRILIYGGYSKEKVKKDVDKGHVYTDAFILAPDSKCFCNFDSYRNWGCILENDTTGTKYKWVQTKIGGVHFAPRCSMSMACGPNNAAYAFGGVFDTERDDDEDISSNFFDDMHLLDLDKLLWRNVQLSSKKDKEKSSVKGIEAPEGIM